MLRKRKGKRRKSLNGKHIEQSPSLDLIQMRGDERQQVEEGITIIIEAAIEMIEVDREVSELGCVTSFKKIDPLTSPACIFLTSSF
mmetsp:Transcript_6338/g.5408  ORF Transcript_6338/g.5408 Transcript_6338/m.5408 type:complete len:86 (-) Transcript_6338:137-394(-)